jgi:glycosyltransferase involved in cell wall biosynthesis
VQLVAYAGPAARRIGLRAIVHTEHGKHYSGHFRRRLLARFAARFARRFFCVSADIAADIRRYRIAPDDKVEVIPNGIDFARFQLDQPVRELKKSLGISDTAPVIGTVGRLNNVKNHALLLQGFARVKKDIPDVHLLLVGDGPLLQNLTALSVSLGVQADVHFPGYQLDPERFLAAMDIFALTSCSEGMPLAILEAWAAGLPVVASAVGGVPELVQPERNGILFPADDEAAFHRAMLDLLRDPVRRRKLGAAGRELVETKFSLQQMAANYQASYARLLAKQN